MPVPIARQTMLRTAPAQRTLWTASLTADLMRPVFVPPDHGSMAPTVARLEAKPRLRTTAAFDWAESACRSQRKRQNVQPQTTSGEVLARPGLMRLEVGEINPVERRSIGMRRGQSGQILSGSLNVEVVVVVDDELGDFGIREPAPVVVSQIG